MKKHQEKTKLPKDSPYWKQPDDSGCLNWFLKKRPGPPVDCRGKSFILVHCACGQYFCPACYKTHFPFCLKATPENPEAHAWLDAAKRYFPDDYK